MMASINQEVFQKFKRAKKLQISQSASEETEVDVREDEEQSIKLQEIIDLLVAAGYFRARIKGLSPFDKVVGGMTWCMESCNIDVDVDLLFQENSTIGQKIALTEKIVAVLPKMKCPHQIEPHQIQGLDFIHIFPVIQWLVKTSMEFRQQQSKFVQSYAVNQFNKQFGVDAKQLEVQAKIIKNVNTVRETYRPRRCFKRKTAPPADLMQRVQITLLEYGHTSLQSSQTTEEQSLQKQKTEEQQIQQFLTDLSVNLEENVDYNELSEEDLKQLSKHYASLQREFEGGLKTQQEKQVFVLEQQIKTLTDRCVHLETENDSILKSLNVRTTEIDEIRLKQQEADMRLKQLEQAKTGDFNNVKEVEELVLLNDSLRSQEIQFKDYCKKELARLQKLIEETKKAQTPIENDGKINRELDEITEKVRTVRLQLAKKNRIVSALQRHLDDIPNRPELAQYQRRFLELYNQVSAKHKETKQYYTLYNTLHDTKLYMQKELSLLNSVSDSYPEAMLSNSGKEEFLKQFQNIVDGVKQSKIRFEKKLHEEKRKRDRLSASLQVLIEQQRKYVAVVRQLSIECKKYESLLSTQQQQF